MTINGPEDHLKTNKIEETVQKNLNKPHKQN